ncbi:MAG: hypothetical protein HY365_01140 [Candidatus Aenigmarchaeota archaeon]|nr:hypothetical protein [Candidatus Aenigmarchaeota archaeon]
MRIFVIMLVIVILSGGVHAADEKVYYFTVNRSDTGLLAGDAAVIPGAAPVSPSDFMDYRVELVDGEGSVLYSSYFSFRSTLHSENFGADSGSVSESVSDSTVLLVPFFAAGKTIAIYDNSGSAILEIPVGHFSDFCGDNVCRGVETSESCPSDCAAPGANKTGISLPANVDPIMLAGAAILVLAAFLYYAFKMAGKSDNLYN